jgi:hypothetical protein
VPAASKKIIRGFSLFFLGSLKLHAGLRFRRGQGHLIVVLVEPDESKLALSVFSSSHSFLSFATAALMVDRRMIPGAEIPLKLRRHCMPGVYCAQCIDPLDYVRATRDVTARLPHKY